VTTLLAGMAGGAVGCMLTLAAVAGLIRLGFLYMFRRFTG
jgi:hypothetical protein